MPDSLLQESRNSVRVCTAADLPWVMSLAYRRYGPYDPGKVLRFLVSAIDDPKGLLLRSDEAFLIASAYEPMWSNTPECNVLFLCAEEGAHWQTISLLQTSIDWARAKACCKWWLGSETESDIGALAKRVGAEPTWPRYKLELG